MDLRTLLPLEPGRTDALEQLLASCLCEAGVWSTVRESDGIARIERILEHAAERVRIVVRIYTIDQTPHAAWLEIDWPAWRLWFDVAEPSERRSRNAIFDRDRADDIAWRVALEGDAELRDDGLVVVRADVVNVADLPASACAGYLEEETQRDGPSRTRRRR